MIHTLYLIKQKKGSVINQGDPPFYHGFPLYPRSDGMIDRSIQIFPRDVHVIHQHISMFAALFGNGHRTGIQIDIILP